MVLQYRSLVEADAFQTSETGMDGALETTCAQLDCMYGDDVWPGDVFLSFGLFR
jgi:hypothetical protein